MSDDKEEILMFDMMCDDFLRELCLYKQSSQKMWRGISLEAGASSSSLEPETEIVSSGTVPEPQITMKSDVVHELLNVFENNYVLGIDNVVCPYLQVLRENKIYKTQPLERYDSEFQQVSSKFFENGEIRVLRIIRRGTFRYKLELDRIEKVVNPYLRAHLQLKKIKKQQIYGSCKALWLFHGTAPEYVPEICKNNFNWRLAGRHVGTKFGKGMSFSPKATYASDYPHSNYPSERTMFVATVINSPLGCLGSYHTTLPHDGTDHSKKPDGDVIVKYEDADYFPEYIIHYRRILV